jgi:hypothetical protein
MTSPLHEGGLKIRKRPDYDERKRQAEARAQWELGDPSWAGVILGAFLFPEADADALERDHRMAERERREVRR